MSSHNILITGASGYLGGTLLARWGEACLPSYDKLFALVRTDAQAESVKEYGAEPLTLNVKDEAAVRKALVDNTITIVFFLIDAINVEAQVYFIQALAEVKKVTGLDVHFLHVSFLHVFPWGRGTSYFLNLFSHLAKRSCLIIHRLAGPRSSLPTPVPLRTSPCWIRTQTCTPSRKRRRRRLIC